MGGAETKTCTNCAREKDIESFSERSENPQLRQSWCKECVRKSSDAWAKNNKPRRAEKQRERRKKNPAHHNALALAGYYRNPKQWNARRKRHRKNNPKSEKSARLNRAYGITLRQYEELLIKQGGGCAICKTITMRGHGKHFHVDHCHNTGRVRGLLCGPCNSALGFMKDSRELLLRAAEYLK